MVDFKRKIGKKDASLKINPIEIYESLDTRSDVGPLRPVQTEVLEKWNQEYRDNKDIILKLNTGQGKTLVGLLMLQAYINKANEPTVYLCPTNQLVEQTCEQARRFGISYTTIEHGNLPDEFANGKKILITSCQKVFNGLSKFGLDREYINIANMLFDDAHLCLDIIRESCKISIGKEHKAYVEIASMFHTELQDQGRGTLADIEDGDFNSFLAIPYWAWQAKVEDITKVLSKYRDDKEVKFAWPIIKNMLEYCNCVISGGKLEIYPYMTPITKYMPYCEAKHRIYMSATISDDSVLIKDLGISIDTVKNPLYASSEKWSGEKMILIPQQIDESLKRAEIVSWLGKPSEKRSYGVVALSPAFSKCADWEKYGAIIAEKGNIDEKLQVLKQGNFKESVVFVNRYDGIDLPDNSCRILVLDSKPTPETLEEKYMQSCIKHSDIIMKSVAQKIEQGFGRGVRGEKDYCCILIIGDDLIKFIRDSKTKKYFSNVLRKQIDMGIEVSDFAKEEARSEENKLKPLAGLIRQSLGRDDGWKEYYVEQMETIEEAEIESKLMDICQLEREAENLYINKDSIRAKEKIQYLLDKYIDSEQKELKGWYLQTIARYQWWFNQQESNRLQIVAHKNNSFLFKPQEGMQMSKLDAIDLTRIKNIQDWIKKFPTYEELINEVNDILTRLAFGVDSDKFEEAIDELGKSMGFLCQRPDKEWKQGPDNLWKIKSGYYLVIECKNQVDRDRKIISKQEVGQMNISCTWFKENYTEADFLPVMIIPTNKVAKSTPFSDDVKVMCQGQLTKLVQNVRGFFISLKEFDLNRVTEEKIEELIRSNSLSIDNIISMYVQNPYRKEG